MNEMFSRVKTFVQDHTPEICFTVAIAAASSAVTLLVTSRDEPQVPDGFVASKDDFKRMQETGDCLLIRTNDYGDFLLGATSI